MKKAILIAFLAIGLIGLFGLFMSLNMVSASPFDYYYTNSYPSYSLNSNSNSNSNFNSYYQGPISYQKDLSNAQYQSSNQNTGYSNSNYNGPGARMDIHYNEYLDVRPSGRIIRTISYSDTSAYLGSASSQNSAFKNDEVTTSNTNTNQESSYSGGFSWSQKNTFDRSNYNRDSSWNDYYYSPVYSDGYYNWRY